MSPESERESDPRRPSGEVPKSNPPRREAVALDPEADTVMDAETEAGVEADVGVETPMNAVVSEERPSAARRLSTLFPSP